MKERPMFCLGCGKAKFPQHPASCRFCGGAVFSSTIRLVEWEKQLSQKDREFLKCQRIDYR